MSYLNTIADWKACVRVLEKQKAFGLDSEFEGVDFNKKESCVNKARIHVFSVGILTHSLNPRGFYNALGAVLPIKSLPYFKDVLENEEIVKAAHNSNVDIHAFYNCGVDVLGVVNTLSLARWCLPGRLLYNLDDVGTEILGAGKADNYNDMFRYADYIQVEKDVTKLKCTCGSTKCKIKSDSHQINFFDIRHERNIKYIIRKLVKKKIWKYKSLTEMNPEHPMWERYVNYARVDAVRAIELYDFLNRTRTLTEIPWYDSSVCVRT